MPATSFCFGDAYLDPKTDEITTVTTYSPVSDTMLSSIEILIPLSAVYNDTYVHTE